MTDDEIYEWLKDAFKRTGKSREGLADELGIDVSAVARMLSKTKDKRRSVSAAEFFVIVKYFDEMPPFGDTTTYTRSSTVPIIGTIGAGVWHEPGYSWMKPASFATLVTEPTFGHLPQHARRVEGTDFNRTFLFGDCPIFVPFWELRKAPYDGDILEVVRTAADGRKETSLRRVRIVKGAYELHHESTDPAWQEVLTIKDIHKMGNIEITGLYIGMFRPHSV